jgi:hypothetical protein
VDKESGEVYSKVVSSGFLVGQGGWGGPKGKITDFSRYCVTYTNLFEQDPALSTSPHPRARLPMLPMLFRATWRQPTYTGKSKIWQGHIQISCMKDAIE